MPFQPGAALYSQGFGTVPAGANQPFTMSTAPSSTTIYGPSGIFQVGQQIIVPNTGIYELIGFSSSAGNLSANWVQISSSSGSVLSVVGTSNQVSVSTSSGTATVSLPSAITTPGSLTTTTTLTATLGNITATNGNLSLATAGNKIVIATGSNASVGTSAAMSGTPGAVTVSTTACSATAKIFFCRATTGGTPGQVSITAQDGTGFTLTSTGNETSTFNWWIINN